MGINRTKNPPSGNGPFAFASLDWPGRAISLVSVERAKRVGANPMDGLAISQTPEKQASPQRKIGYALSSFPTPPRMSRLTPILASVSRIFRRRRNKLILGDDENVIERDMEEIAAYHRSLPQASHTVGYQTWVDLDMDSVFAKIDRSVTMLGRQVLYRQMQVYEGDEVLSERARQQEFFQKHPAYREAVQSQLKHLDKPASKWLAQLVLQPLPSAPRFSWAFIPLSLACLACLLGMVFYNPLLLPAFVLIWVNAIIHMRYGQQIASYSQGFSQIISMLGTGKRLAEISGGESLLQIASLRQAQPAATRLRKQLGWLVMDRSGLPELASSAVEYLNIFFLFDEIVFLRSLSTLRKNQPVLLNVFDSIGSLDASIAAASYWQSLPVATRPRIVDTRQMSVSGIYHPLIRNAVSGSVSLVERSAVIAGPNMAGKTTFIRTVGINLILSRTLNICLASSAILPRATVHSAIKREDALSDGRSYFFAEIDQILGFVKLAEQEDPCLFLIDEPFRGTNTIERIAISASVLQQLAKHQIVLASTHDGELQELLVTSFDMFHFRDQVVDGNYGFDYVIRRGPAQSRNAIRLLELKDYPLSVTSRAERLAALLSAARTNHTSAVSSAMDPLP